MLYIHTTLKKIPKEIKEIDFELIKNAVLGKKYELSLLICGNHLSQKLNMLHRNKNYVPNTLSFRYTKNSGEIILNPHKSNKEARHFGHSKKEHLVFLFIHSLLHLKGYTHGHKMEKEEKKYMKKFEFMFKE